MVENILTTGARHVDEVRNINRELTEKALHMRCLSYLSQIKAQLLTETIFEIDESKKNLLLVNKKILQQSKIIDRQRRELLEKNKELQAFSYSVSHDLRAPLRHIDGYSKMLLEDHACQLNESGVVLLDKIRNAAQHMSCLIDDLLFLSHVSHREVRKKAFDLSEMVHGICQSLQQDHPQRHVECSIEDNISVVADKRLMHITLYNLISNAWKFTAAQEQPCIAFGVNVVDEKKVYYLKDNGIGFNMKYVNKLFKTFERLHKQTDYQGNGIGLATVERIINHHGGQVWAESEENMGATFYFTLE